MNNNRWLGWKIKHGLAVRGRANIPMKPKGIIAKFLYAVHFKKKDVAPRGPKVFNQSCGGTLGPTGETK